MNAEHQPQDPSSTAHNSPSHETKHDLVGGPFAVIESDPGLFTSLTRKLGIRDLEVVEMYDIEPSAVDHLNPRGLILCFLWRRDTHRPTDFDDPAAEHVWFANQLIDDACASHAILNVVLNCPDMELGDELTMFRRETENMSPVMKGLAVSNSPFIRNAHNSLARPADIRGALNTLVTTTFSAQKSKPKTRDVKSSPTKRAKTTPSKPKKAQHQEDENEEETYHFIGYVPAYGKVWELDGLKSGPLEVGELPSMTTSSNPISASPPTPFASTTADHIHTNIQTQTKGWMDVVRPALRMKMQKYGGAAEGGNNIRFSLLAIVDGLYERVSDDLEFLKRERAAIERRLGVGWEAEADPTLRASAVHAFTTTTHSPSSGKTFAQDFGARVLQRQMEILDMPERNLNRAWEDCVRNAIRAKIAVEDEVAKAFRANTDHIKRTHDYEPFFREFVTCLQKEGLLNALLDREEDGRKKRRVVWDKNEMES